MANGADAEKEKMRRFRDDALPLVAKEMPMWQEPHTSPEKVILQQQHSATIRRLVAKLPEPFREAIVLARSTNCLTRKEPTERRPV